MTRLAGIVVALAAVAVAVVVILSGPGENRHHMYVVVPRADNLIAGQDIRLAGSKVGRVEEVELVDRGRAVKIKLGLKDEAWPLSKDSTFTLHWGGTVSFSNRYLQLEPGHGRETYADGERLDPKRFTAPVEYDSLVGTFDRPTRAGLKQMLDNGGRTLKAARAPLTQSMVRAPAAATETARVLRGLTEDRDQFETLLRSAALTVNAIDRADPGLRELLDGAGTTLEATADRQAQLQATLEAAPATLVEARDTLADADPTLHEVDGTLTALRPGVAELRRTLPPLTRVLQTVVRVGPLATSSIRTLRQTTPSLDTLLQRARGLMPDLRSAGTQLAKELPCLRPYTPDIVAFVQNWGDFNSSLDGRDHYFRALPQVILPATTNTQDQDSAIAAQRFPGLRYAFPRPPGNNAGQPWFLPKCGVTQDALDPAKDPESRLGGNG